MTMTIHRRCTWKTVLLLLIGLFAAAQAAAEKQPAGEYSEYVFSYVGLAVARGSLAVTDTATAEGRPARCIEVRASSVAAASFLFHLDNEYITLIDSLTGYPLEYSTRITQGNFAQNATVHFDQKDSSVLVDNNKFVSSSGPVHNIFSALYSLFHHTFLPSETMHLPVYGAGQIWDVEVEAVKVERVATEAGAFSAVLVNISFTPSGDMPPKNVETDVLTNRLTREGKKTRLWIAAGNRRGLVKGEYDLFPAQLYMILTSHRH